MSSRKEERNDRKRKHRPEREYRIVVLGSGGVGKSCLTTQFVQGVFIESYDPTIEDTYRKEINVDGRRVVLEIMDTAGTEQFTGMKDFYLREGDGFLLVFSITSMTSLAELVDTRRRIIELKQDDESFPMVLVGNKSDLEEDRHVSRGKAFALSQSWGGMPYYETSARRDANVAEVFVDVCRQVIRKDLKSGGKDRREDGKSRRRRDDDEGGSRCTIL